MIWKSFLSVLAWATIAASSIGATVVGNISDVTYWVGSGGNQAVLIIDWQDGKNAPGQSAGQALAWGYRWPVGQTRTGLQMLLDIAAADHRLVVDTMYGGAFVFGIGYDLDGDGGRFHFDQWSEMGFPSDADDHFAEGIETGFWGYLAGGPSSTRPTFTKPFIPGTGGPTTPPDEFPPSGRILANGSWDAWVFTAFEGGEQQNNFPIPDVSPALAAVPEPSAALLLGAGGLALAGLRRRDR